MVWDNWPSLRADDWEKVEERELVREACSAAMERARVRRTGESSLLGVVVELKRRWGWRGREKCWRMCHVVLLMLG